MYQGHSPLKPENRLDQLTDLVSYLQTFKAEINHAAQQTAPPLHVPGDDLDPRMDELNRQPYRAQADVIQATLKALETRSGVYICGEMGTGKTLIGATIPYLSRQDARTLILCPGHLVNKWKREIEQTIPNADARIIENLKDAEHAATSPRIPGRPQYYVLSKETAKLGYYTQPAAATLGRKTDDNRFVKRFRKLGIKNGKREDPQGVVYEAMNPIKGHTETVTDTPAFCPNCGARLAKAAETKQGIGAPLQWSDLTKKHHHCLACEKQLPRKKQPNDPTDWKPRAQFRGKGPNAQHYTALYQPDTARTRKLAIADYLKRRHAQFDFLIADEVHELKGADTAQGNALGKLGSLSTKILALTGTLIGGYSSHLFYLHYRMEPQAMHAAGHRYGKTGRWVERYGVVETTTRTTTAPDGSVNLRSNGSKGGSNTSTREQPGISPALFADQLLNSAIFVHLDDVANDLPPLTETPVLVPMDPDLKAAYCRLEAEIKEVMGPQIRNGNRRLLSTYLMTLLSYPDRPFDNEAILLDPKAGIVCQPENLPETAVYAKEAELVRIANRARAAGRKTLVFLTFTGKRDTQPRIKRILEEHGLRTAILRSEVAPKRREAWINETAQDIDVLITNPECVKTGLDLIQFPTIVFYQTGYNVFTLRQASRRSWRLGQTEPVEIFYLTYADTMQARAISLVGRKLSASLTLEGKLSSEGLLAMTGEDEDESLALARALVENDVTDGIESVWKKLNQAQPKTTQAPKVVRRPAPKPQQLDSFVASTPPKLPNCEISQTDPLTTAEPDPEEMKAEWKKQADEDRFRTGLIKDLSSKKKHRTKPDPKQEQEELDKVLHAPLYINHSTPEPGEYMEDPEEDRDQEETEPTFTPPETTASGPQIPEFFRTYTKNKIKCAFCTQPIWRETAYQMVLPGTPPADVPHFHSHCKDKWIHQFCMENWLDEPVKEEPKVTITSARIVHTRAGVVAVPIDPMTREPIDEPEPEQPIEPLQVTEQPQIPKTAKTISLEEYRTMKATGKKSRAPRADTGQISLFG